MSKTIFLRDTTRANGIHVATVAELALEESTAAAGSTSASEGTTTSRLGWTFTSPSGFPDSADWPNGTYTFETDVLLNDGAFSWGLLTVGTSDGHFARVDSGLTTDSETNVQSQAAFTGTGIKTATYVGDWSAGNASDRLEALLAYQRGDSHGTKTLTLETNTTANFMSGPWTTIITVTETGSGADEPAISASVPVDDAGVGVDDCQKLILTVVAESGAGVDAAAESVSVPVSETGSSSEVLFNSTLYPAIDEASADDTDYIESALSPSNDTAEFSLTDPTDPAISSDHVVRYRYRKDASGGAQIDVTISLRQGASTEIATSGLITNISEMWTAGSFTLSGGEADSITDYSDLRLRVIGNEPSGTPARRAHVSWTELEVPEVGAGDQTIEVSETGTGADTTDLSANIPDGETGSGADLPTPGASVPIGEAGAGVDTVVRLALVSIDETGIGTDTLSIASSIPVSDTGVGVDLETVGVLITIDDTGTGAEVLSISASVPLSEAGTGVDGAAIGQSRVVTDSGVGMLAVDLSANVPIGESGSGPFSLTPGALVPVAETGAGVDDISVSQAAIIKTVSDTGAGVDSVNISNSLSVSDTGPGADSVSISNSLSVSDTGAGSIAINSPLYRAIDEVVASETDYIESGATPSNDTAEVSLTDITDPNLSTGHVVRYRYQKDVAAGEQIDITVSLRQGASTEIATTGLITDISNTWADGTPIALSGAEADSITDYSDLRLRFVANAPTPGTARRAQISWTELEVPEVVSGDQTKEVSEAGSGAEALAASASVSITEAGAGIDAVVAAPELILKTVTDTGAGADTQLIAASVPLAEAGSGVDAASVDALLSLTESGGIGESGSGAFESDAFESDAFDVGGMEVIEISASVPVSDTNILADDAIAVQIVLTDSGAGADDLVISALDALTDTGAGVDAQLIAASVPLTEVGSGVDSVSVNQGGVLKSVGDNGAGVDAFEILASIPASDIGSGLDAPDLLANAPIGEGGSGSDSPVPGALVPIDESGAGVDEASAMILRSVSDSGSGVDTVSIEAQFEDAEIGSGVETLSITVSATVSDVGSGFATLSIFATIPVGEAGTGVDALLAARRVTESGFGDDSTIFLQAQMGQGETGQATDALTIQASLLVPEIGAGQDIISGLLALLEAIQDTGVGNDQDTVILAVLVDEVGTGVFALPEITASILLTESGIGPDSLNRFVLGAIGIAEMTFSISERSMSFTISERTATITISQRSGSFTSTGGQIVP